MSFLDHLRRARPGRPLLLDGGLGTHLERRGHDLNGHLWSARVLADSPEEVRAAHEDFFDAGAQIATTCSYQVTFEGCGQEGLRAEALLDRSVRLAREAAHGAEDATGQPRWVAASVGPYGAGPGAGTEYDGAYGLSAPELARWHRPRAEVLAAAGPDLLLAETIPSLPEVEALAEVFSEVTLPVALSLSVTGERLRDGSPLRLAAQAAAEIPGLCALGINCCSTAQARRALTTLREHAAVPLLAYPNSGERWDATERRWKQRPQESPVALIDAPVVLLGGCCRVGLREIARLAEARAATN
ncbi:MULTISPECIES: homocysteine S-methyltransferase [unclassified Corynebacterium]|uniref:homocysteine S-methyltransferase n=1 Tax=unclassified Corynebacterium TaxID=2624378 RepID=UPI0029CA9591|nr:MULTISPECIES: homocysteine S-methyltransferase [unclassified Corynebacterium]WPF66667.1 homocysteine S-methyltransferase [Corynebacterium sp. 22KM0430]WPF69155.1 homocysteine S-methyltransferase [Corynebacterium sp. 21KM1197]